MFTWSMRSCKLCVDGEWTLRLPGSAGFTKPTMATCWLLPSLRSGSC